MTGERRWMSFRSTDHAAETAKAIARRHHSCERLSPSLLRCSYELRAEPHAFHIQIGVSVAFSESIPGGQAKKEQLKFLVD